MTEGTNKAGKSCPICGKPATEKYHPFCSSRCADIDLHRWLNGSYAVPVTEESDEDGSEIPLAPHNLGPQ